VSCKPRYVKRILIMRGFRQGSNGLDSSSPPARSSPTECCQSNGVIIPIGTPAAQPPDEWCRPHRGRCVHPPDEWCQPNAAIDVSRPVGTRGGVGWMRGPGACPGGDATGWLHRTQINVMPAGQAPGPRPAPRPPLVPTGCRQTFPLIPRFGWQKSSG